MDRGAAAYALVCLGRSLVERMADDAVLGPLCSLAWLRLYFGRVEAYLAKILASADDILYVESKWGVFSTVLMVDLDLL